MRAAWLQKWVLVLDPVDGACAHARRLVAEWVWVLDPIDGTKSFITGTYGWGVLIALAHRCA